MLAFDSSAKLNQLGEEVGAVASRMIWIGGSAFENNGLRPHHEPVVVAILQRGQGYIVTIYGSGRRSLIQTEPWGRRATKSLYPSRSPPGTGMNLRPLSTLTA